MKSIIPVLALMLLGVSQLLAQHSAPTPVIPNPPPPVTPPAWNDVLLRNASDPQGTPKQPAPPVLKRKQIK